MGTFIDAIKMGRAIGGEALKLLNSAEAMGECKLKVSKRELRLRLRDLPAIEDDELRKLYARYNELKGVKPKEALSVSLEISKARLLQK